MKLTFKKSKKGNTGLGYAPNYKRPQCHIPNKKPQGKASDRQVYRKT